jgi:hydroxycarboxylate dehydrogenase B
MEHGDEALRGTISMLDNITKRDSMADYRTVKAASLTSVVRSIVKGGGSSDREADLVSTNLVEANLKGHDSHGVGMVPRYIESLKEGGLKIDQHVSVVMDGGVILTLDGNSGYGQVMGYEAMELGAERAKRHGVCVVGLSNAHHIGRIGHWAEQCIGHGLVSIHFVNVLARPIVAPFGGRDARHGTNPFCVGIPRPGKDPIVLDFATSKIAQGKTRVSYNKGEQLAPNTIIYDHGNPTTNPRFTVIEPSGAILPFGEHKCSGLALICELLGGALSGGKTLSNRGDGSRKVLNGMFSILIDPAKMGTGENLAREMESFVAWHVASPPAEGVDHVKIAGEPEREWKKQRLAEGIPVDPTTWKEIVAAGAKVGLDSAAIEKLAN